MSGAPLPRLILLADRQRRPGAVALDPGACPDSLLDALLASASFAELLAAAPCLPAAGIPPAARERLRTAGCEAAAPVDPGPSWPAQLPPGAVWFCGDWDLATAPPAGAGAARGQVLRLAALLARDADNHEIEAVVRQDPALSFHLVRLAGSVGAGARKVATPAQAIMILGRQQIRRWLNLLLFASRQDDPRAAMLMARAGLRARRAEQLARAQGADRAVQERAFTAGMFSLLGILFGNPLAEVIKPLSLDDELAGALLRGEGEAGRCLAAAMALEAPGAVVEPGEIGPEELGAVGFEAARWALGAVRDVFAEAAR